MLLTTGCRLSFYKIKQKINNASPKMESYSVASYMIPFQVLCVVEAYRIIQGFLNKFFEKMLELDSR